MRKMIPVALVAALAACNIDSTEPTTRETAPDYGLAAEYSAAIAATNATAVAGTAALRDYRTYFEAQVSVTNGPANTTLNWRVYPGTCASPGTAVAGGSTQAFAPLTTDAAGSASLTRIMAAHLIRSGDYNVRIMTGTNINTTIACGALQ